MGIRILCFLGVWFCAQLAAAQLRIHALDSGWLTRNMVELGAVFTDKKGNIKQFGSGKNDIPFKKINWELINCKIMGNSSFYFNRSDVLKNGGEIKIIAKYKNKYKDTLVLKLPKPVKIEFGDTIQYFAVGDFNAIKGLIYFADGKVYEIHKYPAFQGMLNVEVPPEIITYSGLIKVTVDVFVRKQKLKVCIDGLPEICANATVQPVYIYILSLNDDAPNGRDGYNGSDGLDGCENCNDRGVDGVNGGDGSWGENGYNANSMELWLKSRYDSIVMVKIKNKKYGEAIYYLDLYHGGKIYVNLHGGNGGAGGKGGKGGVGLDEVNGKGPGTGGNGGNGGDGGNGGNGGTLMVYVDTATYGLYPEIKLFNSGGNGGAGGEGGKSGRGGRKEKAGIIGTLITGRRGDEGRAGSAGNAGYGGGDMVVKVISF